MEVEAVCALRSERGLHRVSGTGPQVVGRTPQTTDERKADTMKTYILRAPEAVESQNLNLHLRPPRPDPGVPALVAVICGGPARRPPAPVGRVRFIGLDVHNNTIAVSLAPAHRTLWLIIPPANAEDVRKLPKVDKGFAGMICGQGDTDLLWL